MTHWILQNNLYSEEDWEALVGALERLGFPYSVHKCVPFAGTLDPEPTPIRIEPQRVMAVLCACGDALAKKPSTR